MNRYERIRELRDNVLPSLVQDLRLAQAEERYLRLLEAAGVPDDESPGEDPIPENPGQGPGGGEES